MKNTIIKFYTVEQLFEIVETLEKMGFFMFDNEKSDLNKTKHLPNGFGFVVTNYGSRDTIHFIKHEQKTGVENTHKTIEYTEFKKTL